MGDLEFFDSHAHVLPQFFEDKVEEVLTRAFNQGVKWVTVIGSSADLSAIREAVDVANAYNNVWAAIGVHPHEAKDVTQETWDGLIELLNNEKKIVALGECGLDYYYDLSPRDVQRRVFGTQLEIAKERNIPVVIHVRDAHDELIDIVKATGLSDAGGVIHCFSADKETMFRYLDLGFYISIPGIVTFKNAKDLQEAVKELPLDRMLIETDSPYLAPVPYRGKKNEPAYVVWTARKIAQIKDMDISKVAAITVCNTMDFYRLYNVINTD